MKWQKSALIARSSDTSWEFHTYFCEKRHPEYWKPQIILHIWQEAREVVRALSCGRSKCSGAGRSLLGRAGGCWLHTDDTCRRPYCFRRFYREWDTEEDHLRMLIKMTLWVSTVLILTLLSSMWFCICEPPWYNQALDSHQPRTAASLQLSTGLCRGGAEVAVTAIGSDFYTLVFKSEPGNTYWRQKWIYHNTG